MTRLFVTTFPNGVLGITPIHGDDPGGIKLAKTMFELSRDGSDPLEHFNPTVHTRAAIAVGIPNHVSLVCREIDDADLPTEQVNRVLGKPTFRNAWEDTGAAIVVNMPKARIIHIDRIEAALKKEIDKENALLLIAEDENDGLTIAAIRVRRKTLRAIPQTFDLSGATTPEDLDALWPPEIPRS